MGYHRGGKGQLGKPKGESKEVSEDGEQLSARAHRLDPPAPLVARLHLQGCCSPITPLLMTSGAAAAHGEG